MATEKRLNQLKKDSFKPYTDRCLRLHSSNINTTRNQESTSMDIATQEKDVPLRYQISYKESEKALLFMEKELMNHFKMGRSDLHKYFLRTNYNLLKNPNPFLTL
jgi:hypothetical protein